MPRTIVDVYQSALSRPLKRKNLSRHPLLQRELATLGEALNEHYKTYQMPTKTRFELRPSISVDFQASRDTGLHYVFGERHFQGTFNYKFDPSAQGQMLDSIKTYLLYCHSIVVQDPLPYLLDYFRVGAASEHATARLSATNSLLCEYADLAELLQQSILIPVSESVIPAGKVPSISARWLNEISSNLPSFATQDVELMVQKVLEEQYRRHRFNEQTDLFFPQTDYVLVLRELLKLSESRFESTRVTEPFGIAVLGSINTVSPDLLSVDDIVRIRSDDSAFDEWRSFLRNVFEAIYSQEQDHLSLNDEFVHSIRHEFSNRRSQFTKRVQSGSLRNVLRDSGKSIGIGVTAGAATWAATGDMNASLVAGAASGGIKPIIELLANLSGAAAKRQDANTFRQHFMAIGLEVNELPR